MPPKSPHEKTEKTEDQTAEKLIIRKNTLMQTSQASNNTDFTIHSSDGMDFQVHSRNIAVMCGNFPGPGRLHDNHVKLPETSEVLDIWVNFLYPEKNPQFPQDMPCALQLAAAAEKYQTFRLVKECYVYMKNSLKAHPAEVLSYATTYKYRDLIPDAVRETLPKPLDEVACSMYPEVLTIWIQYYHGWIQFCQKCIEASRKWDSICCSHAKRARGDFAEQALLNISATKDIAQTILVPTCSCPGCQRARQEMRADIAQHSANIPKYEGFLIDFENFRPEP